MPEMSASRTRPRLEIRRVMFSLSAGDDFSTKLRNSPKNSKCGFRAYRSRALGPVFALDFWRPLFLTNFFLFFLAMLFFLDHHFNLPKQFHFLLSIGQRLLNPASQLADTEIIRVVAVKEFQNLDPDFRSEQVIQYRL